MDVGVPFAHLGDYAEQQAGDFTFRLPEGGARRPPRLIDRRAAVQI